jgi:hypothetical protein
MPVSLHFLRSLRSLGATLRHDKAVVLYERPN